MAQMKEQKKSLGKELNKMETDAEFKILIIRMLSELSENLNSIKNISQKQRIH